MPRVIQQKNLIIVIIITIISVFVNINYTSAEDVNYEINISPALTVTVTSGGESTSNLVLNLNPMNHTFDSNSIDVTVATNNVTGYNLAMSTVNGSTDLTRNQNPGNTGTSDGLSAVLSTLATSVSGYSENDFKNCAIADCTNKWGFKVSSSDTDSSKVTSNYFPFASDPSLAVNHYATNGDTTTLDFAAKIDWNQPAGTYENTLVFTATATYAAYDIKYYNGIDNAENQEIAVQTNDYNTSSNVKLEPGVTPTRSTYDFVKWCDQVPEADSNNYFPATVCNGNTYNTGDTITINPEDYNTNIKLYAYWDPTTFDEAYAAAGQSKSGSYYTMQTMSKDICAAVTINEVTQLIDTRSGNYTYYVAKLKDGKCWMTQNLKLGTNVSSLKLTADDSNVTHSFTILKDSDGKMPIFGITDDRYDNNSNKTTYISGNPSVSAYYCSPIADNNYVGCYYNWYTATAGAYVGDISNEQVTPGTTGWKDVDSSICPKNWYLPTGGTGRSDSDFQVLYNNYPSAGQMLVDGTTTYDNLTGKPAPGLLLSGHYYTGGPYYVGKYGLYWSRSAWSKGVASGLDLGSSVVSPQYFNHKYYGRSVRCLAYSS